MFGRAKVATLVAEFLGTGILTLVFLNLQRSTIGVPYFIGVAIALSVAFMAFAMNTTTSRVQLNPAVTIGLWTARRVTTIRAIALIAAQLIGAYAAYGLYQYLGDSNLQAVGGDFSGRTLVAEAIGTGIIGFGWAAAIFRRFEGGVYASVVGLSYAVGLIISATASAGLAVANPSFALGTHAWEVFGSLGWGNYVLGPVIGAVIGVNLYLAFFAPENSIRSLTSIGRKKTSSASADKPKAKTKSRIKSKSRSKR